jgi:hypothetical protein
MAEGFVAILDVLGFSTMVSGANAVERLREYEVALERTLVDDHAEGVRYVAFSDTIVITTHGDRPEHFLSLAQRCSGLFGFMLEKEIPLRGAIARGFHMRTSLQKSESVFVAGRAILDAYGFEQKQDWVGIMLAPSAVQALPDLRTRCELVFPYENREQMNAFRERVAFAAFVQPATIPFHRLGGEPNDFDGFAVVPTTGGTDPHSIRDSLDRSIGKLDWLKSLAPDPQAQRKYERSSRWLN